MRDPCQRLSRRANGDLLVAAPGEQIAIAAHNELSVSPAPDEGAVCGLARKQLTAQRALGDEIELSRRVA